jgi:ribonucleoside-diphosphate reductase alpha chain
MAERRKLPDERQSITHRARIANHKFYITVGLYEDGTPGELFLKAAKEGSSLSGMMDSFAINFSLALQYGVPLAALVRKFSNSRFEPEGFTEHPTIRYAKSPVDYVARWLALKFLPAEERPMEAPKPLVSIAPTAKAAPGVVGGDGPPCDRCGNLMYRAGSNNCFVCPNCSSTAGGCGG